MYQVHRVCFPKGCSEDKLVCLFTIFHLYKNLLIKQYFSTQFLFLLPREIFSCNWLYLYCLTGKLNSFQIHSTTNVGVIERKLKKKLPWVFLLRHSLPLCLHLVASYISNLPCPALRKKKISVVPSYYSSQWL